jgi:hypothetical protein
MLFQSPELRIWNEGAALAALDAWAAGPVGAVAAPEQLAVAGAAVRLPLVAGPLLAAAALAMPEAAFAAWPLDAMERYYKCGPCGGEGVWACPARLLIGVQHMQAAKPQSPHPAACPTPPRSASLSERYEMTHARLQSDSGVPWSAVRRPRAAAEELATVAGGARLSQLRRLHEETAGWLAGEAPAAAAGGGGGGGAPPRLELGATVCGGLSWRVALVCCPVDAEESQREGAGTEAPARDLHRAPLCWRLGLQVEAAPLFGRWATAAWGAQPCDVAAPGALTERAHRLFSIGAAKAAGAVARHVSAAPGAACGAGPEAAAGSQPAACAALHLMVGVSCDVGEHAAALQPSQAITPMWLSENCCGGGGCGDGGGAGTPQPVCGGWCLRGGGRGCGFCRRGALPAPLPRAGGAGGEGAPFEGWQPERWSALAPGGQLHWRCALRVLTDY